MTRFFSHSALAVSVAACLASCAGTSSKVPVDARTQEVLSAMSARLSAAQTLRFSGNRTAPSGFHAAVDIGESTKMNGVLRRPNQIVVNFTSAEGVRVLGYTGSELFLIDRKANTYSKSPAPPTGEGVLHAIDATFNFVPPAAEFLVADPKSHLLEGVLSVRYVGQDSVGDVKCDHLFFEQKGRTRDLWVAQSDHLPRRITITYPNGGATPLAITTTISQWQINPPVSDADLAINLPPGSKEIESVPLRR